MAEERRSARLDALEATRVAIEAEYLECMHGLEVRADGLRALLAGLTLPSADGLPDSSSSVADAVVATEAPLIGPTTDLAGRDEPVEMVLPGAGLRGWLAAWLFGDLVPALDQRQGAVERALEKLHGTMAALRSDVSGALEHVRHQTTQLQAAFTKLSAAQERQLVAAAEARTDDLHRWRGVGEALDQAVEVLTQVTRLSERLRALVDAKDAETLQRAVDGPSLQIEVIIDELTRRQEALLAELVGRRQELDALIESVSRSG